MPKYTIKVNRQFVANFIALRPTYHDVGFFLPSGVNGT